MVSAIGNDILSRIREDGSFVSTQGSNETLQDVWLKEMQSILNAADKDGINGLSKQELSTINTDRDIDKKFAASLTEQFEWLDADKNGQLTADEMKNVKLTKMGPPAGMNIPEFNDRDNSTNDFKDSIKNLASEFVQKLINTYKDGGVNKLTSSISSLI